MRKAYQRSFTVEVKSGGRCRTTIIPTRAAASAGSPTRSIPELKPEPAAPSPEPRRVLPSLIVPEPLQADPKPMPVVEELPPRRPRGRPRKPRPDSVEPIAKIVAQTALEQAPVKAAEVLPLIPQTPRKAKALPALDLARGERWKRRLGRWSR